MYYHAWLFTDGGSLIWTTGGGVCNINQIGACEHSMLLMFTGIKNGKREDKAYACKNRRRQSSIRHFFYSMRGRLRGALVTSTVIGVATILILSSITRCLVATIRSDHRDNLVCLLLPIVALLCQSYCESEPQWSNPCNLWWICVRTRRWSEKLLNWLPNNPTRNIPKAYHLSASSVPSSATNETLYLT
jgi:hypothetical protein